MVDYVTLRTRDPKAAKTIKRVLDLERKVFEKTGEIQRYGNKEIATRHNMKFTIYDSGLIIIRGSLHTLHNARHNRKNKYSQPMNHDDFTYEKLSETIKYLMEEFNLNPDETRVHHIEFGVNLTSLPFPTHLVLDSLIVYKNKPFTPMRIKHRGQGKECHFTQAGIKIYDKAMQNKLPCDILRFEVKVTKMQALQKNKKLHLSDLLNESTWELFTRKILSELESCIISDTVDQTLLDERERIIFIACENPRTWKQIEKSKRYRYKKTYNNLINQHGEFKIKSHLKKEIYNKLAQLKPDQYLQNDTFLPLTY